MNFRNMALAGILLAVLSLFAASIFNSERTEGGRDVSGAGEPENGPQKSNDRSRAEALQAQVKRETKQRTAKDVASEDNRDEAKPPSTPAEPPDDLGEEVAEAFAISTEQAPDSDEAAEEPKVFAADAEGIVEGIKAALPELSTCYAAWQKVEKSMNIEGRVDFSFTVDVDPDNAEQGKVVEAKILGSELNHVMVEGCILSVMSDLNFEAPKKKMVITYPFDFSDW